MQMPVGRKIILSDRECFDATNVFREFLNTCCFSFLVPAEIPGFRKRPLSRGRAMLRREKGGSPFR